MRRFGAPAKARADQPGTGSKVWWMPIAAGVATLLAAMSTAVREPAVPAPERTTAPATPSAAAPRTAPATAAVHAPPPVPNRSEPASTAQAPSAQPVMPRADLKPPQRGAPAPTAPNRSLCSAANEAAGLCNPQ
jgi:hypothetical protein